MSFSQNIIAWYQENHRKLPWRETKNPYFIWLSEIILQQTRVLQGLPYYLNFVRQYPSVKHLAKADLDEVLRLWQGLGYYSRARNLHFTAQFVVDNFEGEFPYEYEKLIELKGIGDYTASAISSIAANETKAVLDGNVFRVLSRFLGIFLPQNSKEGLKVFRMKANELLDKEQPGIYNQAVMELGALICTPKNPKCEECPVRFTCFAYNENDWKQLPVKLPKSKPETMHFHYFILKNGDKIAFRKRIDKDIWQGLYEFPMIVDKENYTPSNGTSQLLIQLKHILTHRIIYAKFWKVEELPFDFEFYSVKEIEALPKPKLIVNFLNKINIWQD